MSKEDFYEDDASPAAKYEVKLLFQELDSRFPCRGFSSVGSWRTSDAALEHYFSDNASYECADWRAAHVIFLTTDFDALLQLEGDCFT